MKESMRTSSGAVIPRMTAEQAEARSYLTMSLLDKMHLMPVGDPVAYSAAADGSPIYYFDPCRVREAPPENWYIPDEADLIQPMRLENGTLIGRMSTRRAAELGYYIAEPYWGRGFASCAVRQVCDHVFAHSDLLRIFAEPFADNAASCRVLEKAGFALEGILRQNAVKNGRIRDMKLYSRIKSERIPDRNEHH